MLFLNVCVCVSVFMPSSLLLSKYPLPLASSPPPHPNTLIKHTRTSAEKKGKNKNNKGTRCGGGLIAIEG